MTIRHPVERNETLDCVKGVAIFLVIWGHCIQFLFPDAELSYFQNPIFKIIYAFHMPLFMAVGGFLFANSERKYSDSDLLKRRTKRLLFPVITWSALTAIWQSIAHFASTHHFSAYRPHNALWFLTSTLFCVIVALVCRRIAGGHPAVYISAVLLSLALPDSYELNFDKFMLPYFVAGILFYRYRSKIPQAAYKATWAISIATFVVLLTHWKTEYYIYTSGMSLYVFEPWHKLLIVGVRFLAGFAGIGSIVPAIHSLRNRATLEPLAYLGKFTMGIYVLSMAVFPYLSQVGIPHTNSFLDTLATTPIAACVLCAVCIVGTKAIQLNRQMNSILLGD